LEGRLEGCFGILKVEFKIGKMHISKLAHKCMTHENMKLVDIKKLVLVH
jgi:tRNA A-37 threonylcarbamoyl transferase component Bud32